ncbi:MAG: LEPR-XLL domain-containing protein, partial [Betaproteobacteria bacterium]
MPDGGSLARAFRRVFRARSSPPFRRRAIFEALEPRVLLSTEPIAPLGGALASLGGVSDTAWPADAGVPASPAPASAQQNPQPAGTIEVQRAAVPEIPAGAAVLDASGTSLLLAGPTSWAAPEAPADKSEVRVLFAGGVVPEAATLSGSGAVLGDLQVQGTLSPGNSPGVIQINGNLEFATSSPSVITDGFAPGVSPARAGRIRVELGGLTVGPGTAGNVNDGYDQVRVTGSVTLGGELDVDLIGGFLPTVGDSFDFLVVAPPSGTSAGFTGAFDTATGLFGFGDGSVFLDIVPMADRIRLVARAVPLGGDVRFLGATDADDDAVGRVLGSYFSAPAATFAGDLVLSDYTLSGSFLVADAPGGGITVLSDDAFARNAQAGPSTAAQVGVRDAELALLLPASGQDYALYAEGLAVLEQAGATSGAAPVSASGRFALQQNKGAVAVQAATLSVTSGTTTVSVNFPTLEAHQDVIVGRSVTVTVGDAVAVTGDIALSQDRTTGQVLVLGHNGAATLVTDTTRIGVVDASLALRLSATDASRYALFATGNARVEIDGPTGSGSFGRASGTASLFQNTTGAAVAGDTLELGDGTNPVRVVTPTLESGIDALTGTNLTVHLGDRVTVGGNVGISQRRSDGEVQIVGTNGHAEVKAGTTQFGVSGAQFAVRLPGTNPRDYELYATGNAQLSVTNPTGSGTLLSASGTAALYQNLGGATAAARTATVGSGANAISVAVPELVSRVDVLTGTNLQVKVDNYLTLSGNLALGEDRDSGSVLVLGSNGAASLNAGTTRVGVNNARMSLQFNRADPSKYALFATGDAQLAVDNPTGSGLVLSASGTASLFQNTTGLSVVGETLELGAGAHLVSVVTPDLAVGINALTGTGLTVKVGDSLTLGGDIGLSQDRSSGEVLLVGRNGSALIDAGVTRFGVGAAQFALRLPGTNPRQYELYAQGNAQLSVTNPTGSGTLLSASGIATLYRNLGPATRAAYTATVGSGANAISVAVPELV